MLALLVHAALIVWLALGVQWDTEPQPTADYEAEVWDGTAQQEGAKGEDKPAETTPPPAPPPAVQRRPADHPGAGVHPPAHQQDQVRMATAAQPEAEITERRRKQKETRPQQEQHPEQAAHAERQKQQLGMQAEKAQQRRQAQADAEAKARADAQARDIAQKKRQAAEKTATDKARDDHLARMRQLAGVAGGGGEGAAGSGKQAKSSGGPSSGYAARIRAKVRPNITFDDDGEDNPVAVVVVRAAPDGTIVSSRITRPSTDPAWNQAVLRALEKTETLPPDTDGKVPQVPIEITFRLH